MITTLLFDLDGTLLPHDIGFFISKYSMALAMRFADLIPITSFGQALMAASMAMVRNTDPTRTNRDAFVEDFTRRTGLPVERYMPVFDRFYQQDFPKLRRYTRTDPRAREIVTIAHERGFTLAMATNPVFPEVAIVERMRWAGVAEVPYKLITHFENMHFCKPRPEYYREILAHLKADPEECLMIGNDMVIDLAASEVGIRTYLVTDCLEQDGPSRYLPDHQGTLAEFGRFLSDLPSPGGKR